MTAALLMAILSACGSGTSPNVPAEVPVPSVEQADTAATAVKEQKREQSAHSTIAVTKWVNAEEVKDEHRNY